MGRARIPPFSPRGTDRRQARTAPADVRAIPPFGHSRQAGPGKGHASCAEHTAITGLIKEGVDPPAVQRISGHKTLAMVLRYIHLSDDHIDLSVAKLDADLLTPLHQNCTRRPTGADAAQLRPADSLVKSSWYGRRDSNPHEQAQGILSPLRLPFRHVRESIAAACRLADCTAARNARGIAGVA